MKMFKKKGLNTVLFQVERKNNNQNGTTNLNLIFIFLTEYLFIIDNKNYLS